MRLYKRPGSQFFWCETTINGKQVRFSTGKADRREADAQATATKAKRLKEATAAPALRDGNLVAMCAADIARAQAEGASARHLLVLEARWEGILSYFGSATLCDSITDTQIEQYVIARRAHVKGQTIRRELQDLARGFRVAYRRGWLSKLPPMMPKVKSDPPNEKRKGKWHDPEVVRQVFEILPLEMQHACIVAIHTGLRYAELRRLRASMLRETGVGWMLELPSPSTKTKKEREIGVPKAALAVLQQYIAQGRDLLFPRVNYAKAFGTACKRLGYDKTVTLRDLRHMFGTEATQRTGDLRAVQGALGHTDLKTTQRYLSTTAERVQAIADSGLFQDMFHAQTSADFRTAAPALRKSLRNVERETGFEPATFSLEGSRYRDNSREIPVQDQEKTAEKTQPAPHHSAHVPAQRLFAGAGGPISSEYPRVNTYCADCAREELYEKAPSYQCAWCGSHGVVELVDDVVELPNSDAQTAQQGYHENHENCAGCLLSSNVRSLRTHD